MYIRLAQAFLTFAPRHKTQLFCNEGMNLLHLGTPSQEIASLLSEISLQREFSQKSQTERMIYGRQNSFDSLVNQGIHHDTCIFAIAYSRWVHVVISILETIASIRQSQLPNLQKMQNAFISYRLNRHIYSNKKLYIKNLIYNLNYT